MEMILKRQILSEKSTIGRLWVNGEDEFWTLEDKMREIFGRPVSEWKIKAETAIPVGKYKVILAPSPKRAGRIMPLLLDVPGFVGIQIHSGNSPEDTEGCILVGSWKDTDSIRGSREAFMLLFGKLEEAMKSGEPVTIEVRNPDLVPAQVVPGTDA